MSTVNNASKAISYIRVSALAPLIEWIDKRRAISGLLLSRHGIVAGELKDPYALISLHGFVAFLEDAAVALGDSYLGAKLGTELKPADIGPMGILFSLAPTIMDGFDRISRHVNSLQNATSSSLVADGSYLVWDYRIADKSIWPRRQDAEYSVTASCHLVRSCFRTGWNPIEIHFEHAMPESAGVLRRIFKAPVLFLQSSNRIIMEAAEAERVYRRENQQLTTILERHIADLVRQTASEDTLVSRVKALIGLYLGRRPIPVDFFAAELRMSPRTLQRLLEKEGARVSDLTRAHRQELAASLLSARQSKIGDIAQALGYADGAAFCRAFKLWNGETPSCARETARRQKGRQARKMALSRSQNP